METVFFHLFISILESSRCATSNEACIFPFIYLVLESSSCSTSNGACIFPFIYLFLESSSCVTSNGACIFPFTYGGITYNRCTVADSHRAWCSTKEEQIGIWWGHCPAECKVNVLPGMCHISFNTVIK